MIAFEKSRSAVFAGLLLAALTAATPASAGGFAVREQSAEFQGMSFAGDAAAGGGLSGMFWNPAVAGYAPKGYSSESDAAGIFGQVDIKTVPPTTLLPNPTLSPNSGNLAKPAFVPSSYTAYRLNQDTVLALSINSPFGLSTDPANHAWVGQTHNRLSQITTYDATPTLAYRLAPGLSVGIGVQIDYIEAKLQNASTVLASSADFSLEGNDTAVGFTAGVNWMPSSATSIGLGYRSAISHNLKGRLSIPGSANPLAAAGNAINADVTLPDIVTLSLRHNVTNRMRMLGTVEWTHWSDLQQLDVKCESLASPFCTAPLANSIPFHWEDGWMFALGGEYDLNRQWTLRSGAAYELSPIQDPKNRSTAVPDQNRLWISGGASYKFNDRIGFDVGYSHIWGLGGGTDRQTPPTQGSIQVVGDVDSSVDIVSAAVKFKLGGP